MSGCKFRTFFFGIINIEMVWNIPKISCRGPYINNFKMKYTPYWINKTGF